MKDQQKRDQDNTQDGNLGRYQNTGEQQNTSSDISAVDQQEGNMNHGTTGGNFNDTEKEQDNTSTIKKV